MSSVLGTLMCASCLLGTVPAPAALRQPQPHSYLHRLAQCPDGIYRQIVTPYLPRPGDMVFFDDYSAKWEVIYKAAGTGPPFHSGMVFRRPDGSPVIIEAGADDGLLVAVEDLEPRLRRFKGDIWVRQVKRELSPELSAKLTQFCLAQEGKPYALPRLLQQGTLLRCRMGLRYQFFAHTYLNRDSWLCSELVVAAGTVVGLFDPHVHPANAIYPRDLVDDRHYPLRHNWEDAALWQPTPEPMKGSLIPR